MKKLSKAQNAAMLEAILNEYRQHRFDFSDKKRGIAFNHGATQSTVRALAKADLADGIEIFGNRRTIYKLRLSDTGRQVAIDLLHEDAQAEMESAFKYRDMESNRIAACARVKYKIIEQYNLTECEVDVLGHYDLRDMSLQYEVSFNQEAGQLDNGQPYFKDYVRITHTRRNGYCISNTSSHWDVPTAKRMTELMLIAVQIIESGILD